MENKKLFVGNLPFSATEEDLTDFVKDAGHAPVRVSIPLDRETRKSRGFGFVEFESADDARKAEGDLNGQRFMDRRLNVNVAREREQSERPYQYGPRDRSSR